jgi:nicotinamidase/pyrazinamidase
MNLHESTADGRTALLVVDVQYDFLPGGALAVAEGDRILPQVAALMRDPRFAVCVASQDWHPAGHASFASRHGREPFDRIEMHGHGQTLWPDHCIRGTPGAALHASLPWERVDAIVRKGVDPDTDSYSAFRNNWNAAGERPPTGLAGYLRERGIDRVWLCGLARDYCVRWSAEDAAAAGFQTTFVWDLTRPVDRESDGAVRTNLTAAGVTILDP